MRTPGSRGIHRPFAIAHWNRDLAQHLIVRCINRSFGLLKRSAIPDGASRLVIEHYRIALSGDVAETPLGFAGRRESINRKAPMQLADSPTWVEVWGALGNHRIPNPTVAATISLSEIVPIRPSAPFEDLDTALWPDPRTEQLPPNGVSPRALSFRNNSVAPNEAFRAPTAGDSAFGKDNIVCKSGMGAPPNFEQPSPPR